VRCFTLVTFVLACFGVSALHAQAVAPSRTGVITGRVVDQAGAPVPYAKVDFTALPQRSGRLMDRKADDNGHFSVELPFGKYLLVATKTEAGYPNARAPIYDRPENDVIAELSDKTPNVDVTVKVGPRAGVIIGQVVDEATRKAVNTASAEIHRADNPAVMYGTSITSDFRLLIPPSVPVYFEVKAEGYEPWRYTRNNRTPASLTLKSDESMTISIRLKPAVTKASVPKK
jgi:Carboxypeptidase regulatory-like domain